MSRDQLHSHLEEFRVSHELILLDQVNQMKAVNQNQNHCEDVASRQEALQQSLNTAEEKITGRLTGHDWALHGMYQRITTLEDHQKGGE